MHAMTDGVRLEAFLAGIGLHDLIDNARPRWHRDAAWLEHPEVNFFPGRGGSSREARAVCASCLVRDECLRFATENAEEGIWGGTSLSERRAIRREAA